MVALSARNGEILWDTPAAPDASRVNTSGAIVIGDKVLQGLTGCGAFRRPGLLHQRLRHHDRQAGVALLHDSARGRALAARRGGNCR